METHRHSKIAIIILVWNDYINTKNTIDSVLKNKGCEIDVFVVDNASTDECIDKIKNDYQNVSNIHYLMNSQNWGYAEGNNIAIRYCMDHGYDYFFILNNDIIFDSDSCIFDLWKVINKDKSIGILAPVIWGRLSTGGFAKGDIMLSSLLDKLMMKLNGIKIGKFNEYLYRVPTVPGSFMVLSRRCIELNKGFEKNFFMYVEENDLCIRTNLSGLKVAKLDKDYGVKHLGGTTNYIKTADWKRVLLSRNRILLTRTFPLIQRFLYCSLLFIQNIRLVLKLCKKKKFKSAIIVSMSYFEGLYDLVRYKRFSKNDKLFTRGKELASSDRIYGIKIR